MSSEQLPTRVDEERMTAPSSKKRPPRAKGRRWTSNTIPSRVTSRVTVVNGHRSLYAHRRTEISGDVTIVNGKVYDVNPATLSRPNNLTVLGANNCVISCGANSTCVVNDYKPATSRPQKPTLLGGNTCVVSSDANSTVVINGTGQARHRSKRYAPYETTTVTVREKANLPRAEFLTLKEVRQRAKERANKLRNSR